MAAAPLVRVARYVPLALVTVAWCGGEMLGKAFASGVMALGAVTGILVAVRAAGRRANGWAFLVPVAVAVVIVALLTFVLAAIVAIVMPALVGRARLSVGEMLAFAGYSAFACACIVCAAAPTTAPATARRDDEPTTLPA